MARDPAAPIPANAKRTVREIYEQANELPDHEANGSVACKVKHQKVLRAILVVGHVAPFTSMAVGEGDPPSQTLRISNAGDAPLTLNSVTVPPGVFALSSEARGTVLDAGAYIDLTVSASHLAAGLHQATITVVSTAGNGSANVEASAYDLIAFAPRTSPIAPDVDDADLRYTIVDPRGAVGRATITIHEIVRPAGTLGRVIATFAGLPHVAAENAFAWRGAVAHADYPHGFIMRRGISYRAKVTIARADGSGARERLCDVAVKDVGELLVTIQRHDGAALAGHVTFQLTNVATGTTTVHTTVAQANPHREELVVKGLDPARYELQIQNLGPYLGTEGLARIGPDRTGRASVQVKLGERARTTFELTDYTRIQLVGFHATPTGTNRSLAAPGTLATYKGEPDDRQDMIARCEVMKQAMISAQGHASTDASNTVLKVFMAPEFYFRGQGGGYPLDIVEDILPRMLEEARKPEYTDWIFVYGTAIGYLKHGDGAREQYELRIVTNLGGAPQRVRVRADTTLTRDRQCSVGVCRRIPAGPQHPLEWTLRQGVNEAGIWRSIRVNDQEYELELLVGAPPLAVGPVMLREPLSTEVFNLALIQRGGPNPGGLRDRLVYKDYVSSIDFLGLHHPDTHADFYSGVATHLADIHGTGERLLLPTAGSVDAFSSDRNPSATGGTSEHDKSGLGGGSLFLMGGLNLAVEVCLDHLSCRLNTYVANATPGDPKPQLHLIPSWGMTIAQGPIYTVASGLVLNVDGRTGAPPEAGTFSGHYRCPDRAHNATVHNPPSPVDCPQQHYKCTGGHHHFEHATHCSRCGTALVPVYTCTGPHEEAASTCSTCGTAGLPIIDYECWIDGRVGVDPCPMCTFPTTPVYACTAPHLVTATIDVCGRATVPYALSYCPAGHDHTEHAAGNCRQCGTPLTAETRKLLNDWTVLAPTIAGVAVPDPAGPYALNEQTVTTTTRITVNASGLVRSETTTVAPPSTPPLAIPTAAPATDVTTTPGPGVTQRVTTWTSGPFTTTSTRVETTVVGPLETTLTTVVTTARTGNVTGAWAQLFAQQGTLTIYPVRNVPEAETVP